MGKTSVDIGDILRLPCSSDKSAVSGFEFAGTFKTLIPSADETELFFFPFDFKHFQSRARQSGLKMISLLDFTTLNNIYLSLLQLWIVFYEAGAQHVSS